MKQIKKTLLIGLLFLLVGCDKEIQNKSQINKDIAAEFDGGNITLQELDNIIKDELYEQLYGIYYIRNGALEELLAQTLILKEAKINGLTKDDLLDKEVYSKLSDEGLNLYCIQNQVTDIVINPTNPFKSLKISSKEGKDALWDYYKKKELEKYCVRLMEKYHVKMTLAPPLTPKKNLDSIQYVGLGKSLAKVNVWIMSDFSCESCRKTYPVLSKIYKKYKDRVEFRYTNLSDRINFAAVACECANQQGEYKSMYDYIYTNDSVDSLSISNFMNILKKDMPEFTKCMKDQKLRQNIQTNLNRIKKLEILTTPSIFINNRLYHGQINEKNMSDYIDGQL